MLTAKEKQRLKTLLSDGFYFPRELPPQFTTAKFAEMSEDILKTDEWESTAKKTRTKLPRFNAEIYSVPKLGGGRRRLSIVNPVAQMRVALLIAKFWDKIREHFQTPKCSAHVPKIEGGKASNFNFNEFTRRKIAISARHTRAVSADILRCYETIYTHAIAWAWHGKDHYKKNARSLRNEFGDVLDEAIRSGQDGQSVGVPVGPYTSRIVSEIIGIAIDKQLGYGPARATRHVDDWFIGISAQDSAHKIIANVEAKCREFGFDLNRAKTKETDPGDALMSDWRAELLHYNAKGKKPCVGSFIINSFFAKAFSLAKKHPDQGVLEYAVACAQSWSVKSKADWELLEGCIMAIARNAPGTIGRVAKILALHKKSVNRDRIRRLICDLIRDNAGLGHHFEVAWALSLAKEFDVQISEHDAESVSKMASSVCALLLQGIRIHETKKNGAYDTGEQQSRPENDGDLNSDMWLLAYADMQNQTRSQFSGASEHFRVLCGMDVLFYDKNKSILDGHPETADSEY